MMQINKALLVLAACWFGLGQAYAQTAGDVEQGRIKANTCMGCHGIANYSNVYPTYSVPKLGGQHPQYLAAALKAYRSGERSHPTMRAQAAQMSDEDIADIAAYLSQSPSEE